MYKQDSINNGDNMPALAIVWRNPNPVPVRHWRHNFERADEGALYTLQEYVEDGEFGYWATISNLEVMVGGRAA